MDIDEIVTLLPEEVREVAKDKILSAIEAEKQAGIAAYQKKDKETLKLKSVLKDLGYDHETYSSVEEFKTSIKTKTETADKSNLTLKMLQEQLSDIKTQLANETNLRVTSEEKVKTNTIKDALLTSIGGQFYGDNYLIENILNSKRLDLQEGKIVTKDGKDYDSFISEIFEQNKENQKVQTKEGVALTVKPGVTIPINKNSFGDKLKEKLRTK